MHRFIEILKSHPYAIGAGVLIGAALIYFMTRSGSTTGGTYSAQAPNPEVALAQVNAQLVAAQDATRMQGNIAAQALEAKKSDNATSLAIAQSSNATALAINDNARAITQQAETDKANLSMLTVASQTALAQSQQGYTAELAAQTNAAAAYKDAEAQYTSAYNKHQSTLWFGASPWGVVSGNMNAIYGGGGGGGGAQLSAAYGLGAVAEAAATAQAATVASQAGSNITGANAALASIYAATLHLTQPASNSPTAPVHST